MNVAKECLLATLKVDPKAAHAWANLANVYFVTGDHRSSAKCLEKVLMDLYSLGRAFLLV